MIKDQEVRNEERRMDAEREITQYAILQALDAIEKRIAALESRLEMRDGAQNTSP